MHITLKFICETLSRIAVKISFLWSRKHCVYEAEPFEQLSRPDIYVMLRKILLLLFCIWTSYVKHSDYLVLIWKF